MLNYNLDNELFFNSFFFKLLYLRLVVLGSMVLCIFFVILRSINFFFLVLIFLKHLIFLFVEEGDLNFFKFFLFFFDI